MVNVVIEGLCHGAALRIEYQDGKFVVYDLDRETRVEESMLQAGPEMGLRYTRRTIHRDSWIHENDAAPYSRILITEDTVYSSDKPEPEDDDAQS